MFPNQFYAQTTGSLPRKDITYLSLKEDPLSLLEQSPSLRIDITCLLTVLAPLGLHCISLPGSRLSETEDEDLK